MRRNARILALVLASTAVVGCGEPDVGGSGRLERAPDGGAGDHLVLEGTPYQTGWWHGHLLKDRIRALHEAWQREAFAKDGDLGSEETKARRKAALALVEPVLQNHLPEAVRQELQGLSDACGLPARTLLLTEMLTDILRFTEQEPRLLTAELEPEPSGLSLWPDGPWARLLVGRWVWITRPGEGGARVTVLTWPGSLGGVLCARADGLVAAAAERRMDAGREGLAGLPFKVSLRLAAARSDSPEALLGALAQTTGHDVLALDVPKGAGRRRRLALAPDDAEPVALPPPQGIRVNGGKDLVAPLERAEATGAFGAVFEGGSLWVFAGVGGSERRLRVP